MANGYRSWYASDEQEYILQTDEFLRHVVGWYRVYTYSDTASERRYAWISEGEVDDNRPPRIVSMHGTNNEVRFDVLLVADGGFNFSSGTFNTYLGASAELEFRDSIPGRCMSVANKERVCPHVQTSITDMLVGYVGFIDSFYSAIDDPNPALIRGQTLTSYDWLEDTAQTKMLRADDAEYTYKYNWNNSAIDEGYPNPRDGSYSFYRPIVYYDGDLEYNELRGRLKGVYYCRAERLAHGSFVKIDEQYHLVVKTTNGNGATAIGPVSEDGIQPTNYGWQARPDLDVDYNYRGLELDLGISGTLALWRFDTGHLDGYVYGSGSALPVPTIYADEVGTYDLTAQNGVTSVQSRLKESVDLDGSTHYATASGNSASSLALKDEWTFECVFMPDTIPTAAGRATILDYGSSGSSAVNNTLLRVSVSPAVGTTPDVYNIERGNIEVYWERDTNSQISNSTSGDFIQQNRWNYIAITKEFNGTNYDVSMWHCSFGDHLVPSVKAVFLGVVNSTSGTSGDWYVGTTEALGDYLDGKVDDTRITARVLSDEEIINSCSRTML